MMKNFKFLSSLKANIEKVILHFLVDHLASVSEDPPVHLRTPINNEWRRRRIHIVVSQSNLIASSVLHFSLSLVFHLVIFHSKNKQQN